MESALDSQDLEKAAGLEEAERKLLSAWFIAQCLLQCTGDNRRNMRTHAGEQYHAAPSCSAIL
jgi:hypothetical protein